MNWNDINRQPGVWVHRVVTSDGEARVIVSDGHMDDRRGQSFSGRTLEDAVSWWEHAKAWRGREGSIGESRVRQKLERAQQRRHQ